MSKYVNLNNPSISSVLLEEIDDLRQGRSSRVKKSGGAESDSEMSISESIIVKNATFLVFLLHVA